MSSRSRLAALGKPRSCSVYNPRVHAEWDSFRDFARSVLQRIPAELAIALVIAGVLGILNGVHTWAVKKLRRRRFKAVFGEEVKDYYLAFGSLIVQPGIIALVSPVNPIWARFPFTKMSQTCRAFSAEKVASNCEIRAVEYVGVALDKDGEIRTRPVTDDSISDKLDIDFVSFGASSNLKTLDVFANAANELAEYDDTAASFVSKMNRQALHQRRNGYDYGIILKIHPAQFPKRTWIACAGCGEWGTSGAAWFLAKKWREIAKRIETSEQFVCAIEVKIGQDESAVLLRICRTPSETAAA
jgi:hypothetical protein